jgi:hypothetical protein
MMQCVKTTRGEAQSPVFAGFAMKGLGSTFHLWFTRLMKFLHSTWRILAEASEQGMGTVPPVLLLVFVPARKADPLD